MTIQGTTLLAHWRGHSRQVQDHWVQGWRYLGIIHRIEQNMTRPDDYEYLLALCKNEIPKVEAKDLLVN